MDAKSSSDREALKGYRVRPGGTLARVGYAGVDSGCLMVADPAYFFREREGARAKSKAEKAYPGGWEEVSGTVTRKRGGPVQLHTARGGDLGAVAETGGDGSFPVYVERGKDGAPRRIIVELDRGGGGRSAK